MIKRNSAAYTLALLAGCLALPGCSDTVENAPEDAAQSSATLASVLAEADGLGVLNKALTDTGLNSVFDGASPYTVLAPDDSAFDRLGESKSALLGETQRPVLVAALRDHILPGALDIPAIRAAIEAKGGPVEMTSLGDSTISFDLDGDSLMAKGSGEAVRIVADRAVIAANGVVLPVEGFVEIPPTLQTDQ